MSELTSLPNIGNVLEEQLMQVGITSVEKLKECGSREAWLRIFAIDPSACYQRLCALEGAIQGVRSSALPDEVKADLKAFYRLHRPKK